MIQRIQTVYLAIAAILLSLTYAFNFATYHTESNDYVFSVFGLNPEFEGTGSFIPYSGLIPVLVAAVVFTILQYKKRKLQLKIVRVVYVLIIATLALLFFNMSSIESTLKIDQDNASYGASLFLIAASWPLVFLAVRGIKNDEKLVRSVERLR